jgi:drug/metabolite transporter (DMT)-like permease
MLVTYLVPVTALALGAAVPGEAITARAVGGALLIALGLAALDGRWFQRRAEIGP